METVNLLSLITSGASRCSSTIMAASTWDATTLETQHCLEIRQLSIQILEFFLSLPKLNNFKRQLMKNHGLSRFSLQSQLLCNNYFLGRYLNVNIKTSIQMSCINICPRLILIVSRDKGWTGQRFTLAFMVYSLLSWNWYDQ